MESVEHVINLSEVIDARRCERIKGEFRRAGWPAREKVAVDRRLSGHRRSLRPSPATITDDLIAEQCRQRRLLVLRCRSWWIKFRRRVGLILELRANSFGVRWSVRGQLDASRKKTALVSIPADQQGHIILLSLRINRRGVLRYHVSVNDTESIRDWALDRSCENVLGRFGARFGNRI